jgi:hypothetical protein
MPIDRRAKGAELEEAFAEWMTTSLGFTSVSRKHYAKGKAAARGYQVDVHGQLYNPRWRALYFVAVCIWLVAAAALIWPQQEHLAGIHDAVEDTVRGIAPEAAGYGLALLGVIAALVGRVGKKRTTLHAWVECKNRQTSVKRADIEKLQGAVRDVRENPGADWKPARVMMVSGSGFDVDALAIARTLGIECWERTATGLFRRVGPD